MAFALLLMGIVLIVVAIRNQQDTFVCVVKGDFTGAHNFLYWIVALLVLGAIGYVEKLKPLSDGLLLVIIVALFLTSGQKSATGGGFFQQFQSALGNLGNLGGTGVGVTLPGGGVTLPGGEPIVIPGNPPTVTIPA